MLSVFVGAFLMGLILNAAALGFDLSNPHLAVPAYYHLLAGGLAFGAVFMATDPVTATQTTTGKYILWSVGRNDIHSDQSAEPCIPGR